MNIKKQFRDGLLDENPVTVQLLGMCSTMAITTTLFNGIGMGISVLIILTCSNIVIAAIRKLVPNKIRIACYIVVIAAFVTMVDLLLQAFLPDLSNSLGVFLPLIVVNCIILGRAEAYANKHKPMLAVFDGLGMGLGFTVALTLAGLVREILGNGTAFGLRILPASVPTIGIFVQPPGAFLVIALFIVIMNAIGIKTRQRQLVESEGCTGNCAACAMTCDKKEGGDAQ